GREGAVPAPTGTSRRTRLLRMETSSASTRACAPGVRRKQQLAGRRTRRTSVCRVAPSWVPALAVARRLLRRTKGRRLAGLSCSAGLSRSRKEPNVEPSGGVAARVALDVPALRRQRSIRLLGF